MLFLLLIGLLVAVLLVVLWSRSKSGSVGRRADDHVKCESEQPHLTKADDAIADFQPSPPTPPTVSAPAEATATGHIFDHVTNAPIQLDISPDGLEVALLHDETDVTIFDAVTGKALQTWRGVCPPEWLKNAYPDFYLSCAARRLFAPRCLKTEGETSPYIIVDFGAGEIGVIDEEETGEEALMEGDLSADGRWFVGFPAYSKEQIVFDLERRERGGFGDVKLEAAGWPQAFIAANGLRFAFRNGDEDFGDVDDMHVWRRTDDDADAYRGPDLTVSCDSPAQSAVFSPNGEHLLVIGEDGDLTIAACESGEQCSVAVFPAYTDVPGDGPIIHGLALKNGGVQAVAGILRPNPYFCLVDLERGVISKTIEVEAATVSQSQMSIDGSFALVLEDDGNIQRIDLNFE